MLKKHRRVEQLDFSEEVCMERYCLSSYFNEDDKAAIHIDGVSYDDSLICDLTKYGSLMADGPVCKTWQSAAEEPMPLLRAAA